MHAFNDCVNENIRMNTEAHNKQNDLQIGQIDAKQNNKGGWVTEPIIVLSFI